MKKRGVGIGSTFYGTGYGNGFPDVSKAIAELEEDGKVNIYVGATEVGQGAKTIMSQIPAEVLGLKVSDIVFINEDTKITPDSGTAAASRQTYNTGNAIKLAAEELRKELTKIAAKNLNLNNNIALEFKDGEICLKTFPSKKISIKDIAKIHGKIRKEGEFVAQTVQMDTETGQGAPYWPYTFSACEVEVEVDTDTGRVDVIRAAHGQDVGRALNPLLIEGQMDGGFAMGMGYAIFEDIGLKNGKMKNNRFTNYILPTAMDVPDVQNIIIEDPESTAPFGAKGIGEPTMVSVAPAILNAIYNAVGVRVTEIPVTPEKLLKAMKKLDL
ncbi:molybdopterin cofactor-binding domain-containing protein [Clostridium sp. Marseille-Q2269]|uniref:xanthine dehydrogenase family protein molybdopterin-binding subunit n=1 Tax=Clostridium sp. Marseille-Q2269 TaxID=2942205 RepID=UPI0020742DC1|nr:molybdopterin cofactor-binding domain-containing protein [Clostridium sp. Marseille-Q2269]